MRRSGTFKALFITSLACVSGCDPSVESKGDTETQHENEVKRPYPTSRGSHVLLVTLDTVRTDRLSIYGGSASTPQLAHIAEGGWIFSRAYAPYPLTLPSHTTILSGFETFEHKVRDNSTFHVPKSMPLLAESLKEAGYETAAFVSAFVLDRRYGLDRGFDHYDDEMQTRASQNFPAERNAAQTISKAQQWIAARDTSRPFFVWIHLYDPHAPYNAPQSFPRSPSENPYDVEIRYADQEIGRLWQWMERDGLADKTLAVVTSDHGESLGEHGEKTHGFLIYEGAMRVPLIMTHPALRESTSSSLVLDRPVGLHQIAPSILAFLEIEPPSIFPNRPHLLTQEGRSPDFVYFDNYATWHGYGMSPIEGIVDNEWKLIHAPVDELFNVVEDPEEKTDLASEKLEMVSGLLKSLEEYKEAGAVIGAPSRSPMSNDERLALEALGYVVSSADMESVPVGQGMNPKDHVGLLDQLEEVDRLIATRAFALAAALSLQITTDYPRLERGLSQFAISLHSLGRSEEACDVARRILSINPDRSDARLNLGRVLFSLKKYEESRSELEICREKGERSLELFIFLARSLAALREKQEAIQVLDEALDGPITPAQRQQLSRLRAQIEAQ